MLYLYPVFNVYIQIYMYIYIYVNSIIYNRFTVALELMILVVYYLP